MLLIKSIDIVLALLLAMGICGMLVAIVSLVQDFKRKRREEVNTPRVVANVPQEIWNEAVNLRYTAGSVHPINLNDLYHPGMYLISVDDNTQTYRVVSNMPNISAEMLTYADRVRESYAVRSPALLTSEEINERWRSWFRQNWEPDDERRFLRCGGSFVQARVSYHSIW